MIERGTNPYRVMLATVSFFPLNEDLHMQYVEVNSKSEVRRSGYEYRPINKRYRKWSVGMSRHPSSSTLFNIRQQPCIALYLLSVFARSVIRLLLKDLLVLELSLKTLVIHMSL